jgi:putative MATE family efflux protein
LPAALVVMAGTGYLRGTSDTVTPLWIALGTVALNLVLEIVTIYGLGWGVAASAASTVLAQWVAAAFHFRRLRAAAAEHRVSLRPHGATLRGLGSTGVPLFIRTAALRGVVGTSVALAGRFGPATVAGYGIAFGIWSFFAYLSDGLEVAGQVLVAETSAGPAATPGDLRAATLGVTRRILRMALWIGIAAGVLVLALRTILPHLFSDDPEVIAIATGALWWVALAQPLNSVVFAADGILVGAGDLRYLAVAMCGAAALYGVGAIAVVAADAPVTAVWVTLVGFMAARGAGLGARVAWSGWPPIGSRPPRSWRSAGRRRGTPAS